ncbi:MAG: nucleotidyltransferase domain-containing protein [bacterium]|nr:nucleotidyltransferase domain-containing protein [bacterium]
MNEDTLAQIKIIAERLKKEYKAKRIILFGSYATGEATEDSDVDLFIIVRTQERFFERMAHVRALIRDLRKGLPVAPIIFTQQEFKKRVNVGDQFIKEILEKGVTL